MTEIRLAFRQVVRAPVISATIVLLLTLGVSLNAALFSVVDGLLFRPLPFPGPNGWSRSTPSASCWRPTDGAGKSARP